MSCRLDQGPSLRSLEKLNALLLTGETEEAEQFTQKISAFSYLASLLPDVSQPGEGAKRAWSAYHILLHSGKNTLDTLEVYSADEAIYTLLKTRTLRRIGLIDKDFPVENSFVKLFCDSSSIKPSESLIPLELRYEIETPSTGEKVSMEIDETGKAKVFRERKAYPREVHVSKLSLFELQFLLEKACRTTFWEIPSLQNTGEKEEAKIRFSIEFSFAKNFWQQEIILWEQEWNEGALRSLATLLEATRARVSEGGLLWP